MLIDFHAHVFLDKLAAGAVSSLAAKARLTPFADGTVSGTKALMRAQGVDKFVALNIAVAPRTQQNVNNFAISLLSDPIIVPFGSVHPDSPDALSELIRLHAAGVRGVKFHNEYQNFFVDDEKAFPIYEKCEELGLIMLFHGGADRGFEPPVKATPARIRKVALAFPRAKIVAAHLGGQAMEQESVQQLADTNVWIDTSFASRCVSSALGEEVIRAFGEDRVLFGTDCPWDTPANTVHWLEKMPLSQTAKQKIYSQNALRLLARQV